MYRLLFILVLISISCSNEVKKPKDENPKKTIEMCIDNDLYTVEKEEIDYEWHITNQKLKEKCDPELGCIKSKCLEHCIENDIKSSKIKCKGNYLVEEKNICINEKYTQEEKQITDCSALNFETYDKSTSQIINYNGICNQENKNCELKKNDNFIQCESAHKDNNDNYVCNTNCIEGTTESKKECTDNNQYLITKTKTCINDKMIIKKTHEEKCGFDDEKRISCIDDFLIKAIVNCSIETGCSVEATKILCDTGCQVNENYDKDNCIETCNTEGIIETKTECKDNSIIQKTKTCEDGIIKYNQKTIETCLGLISKTCKDGILTKELNNCQKNPENNIAECSNFEIKEDATCIDDKLTEEYCDDGDRELNRTICENGYNKHIKQTCENNNWKSTITDSTSCNIEFETRCNQDNTKTITNRYCENNMCIDKKMNISEDYSRCTGNTNNEYEKSNIYKICEITDDNIPTINTHTEFYSLNDEKINIIINSQPCKDKTYCNQNKLINSTVIGCDGDTCKYEYKTTVCNNKCINDKCQN